MEPLRLKIIACNVLFRELSVCAAYSPHLIDVEFLHRSLHNDPDKLRREVQQRIDACVGEDYDYLLLGYALCSNGTAFLQARDIPLVIPRGHDCITLLLGSREAYDRTFHEAPGTYYYTPGWIEREGVDKERTSVEGEAARQRIRLEYVEKYGEANADYLLDMLHSWHKNYNRALFIEMGLVDMAEIKAKAKQVSAEYKWRYDECRGDLRLARAMVSGDWDAGDFLVVPPGAKTAPSYRDNEIICLAED